MERSDADCIRGAGDEIVGRVVEKVGALVTEVQGGRPRIGSVDGRPAGNDRPCKAGAERIVRKPLDADVYNGGGGSVLFRGEEDNFLRRRQ